MTKEVGFGSLSNHFLQRSRRNGSNFNLLLIGPAGCGKSTLLSNLYNQEILAADRRRNARLPGAIEFIDQSAEVLEAGVSLRLKITEVLGYGELSFAEDGAKTNREKINKIVKNVEDKHRQHFDSENFAKRAKSSDQTHNGQLKDQLYHAAVVFIQPQRNLNISALDLALIQSIQTRVNVIPVIAKADSYTGEELCRIKANLKRAFNESKILLFPNITDVSDDDWVIRDAVDVRSHCPFVTIAASVESGARFRQYPWGLVSIDAPIPRSTATRTTSNHALSLTGSNSRLSESQTECCGNDLLPMQKMLIRSHFEFLKRHTVDKLYENYRTEMVCNVQLAPEAPMRLNKSRDSLQQQPQPHEQEDQSESQKNDQAHQLLTDDEELFQSTTLDSICEEDDNIVQISLSGSLDALKPPRKGKNKGKGMAGIKSSKNVSAEILKEVHDDLVSPLPTIQ